MAVRVAINGFGRIGRNILRAIVEGDRDGEIQVVAVNDLGPIETNAHLLRYDSVHGRFPHEVKVEGDTIVLSRHRYADASEFESAAERVFKRHAKSLERLAK